jgi:hypothetical protein
VSREHGADVAIYLPRAAALYLEGGGLVAGAERQSGYLARGLAAAGLRVRHIIDPVPGRQVRADGPVEPVVLDLEPEDRRLSRYRGIAATLKATDARLYIQICASHETGVVGTWARLHRRRFVFKSSHDSDFMTDAAVLRTTGAGLQMRRVMLQYRIGIHMAERVVVQTERQRELAQQRFGIEDAVVIPNAVVLPPLARPRPREAFLWIGGIIGVKDPLSYVELARRVPEARFWMVPSERRTTPRDLADRLRTEAAGVANLELIPAMSSDEILDLYERAVGVVSTSHLEGFPNVFLEGWSRGTPALSLRVDPDRVIETHGLGAVCNGSPAELASAARRLWAERATIDRQPYRDYVARNHDPNVVGGRWAGLVRELLDG